MSVVRVFCHFIQWVLGCSCFKFKAHGDFTKKNVADTNLVISSSKSNQVQLAPGVPGRERERERESPVPILWSDELLICHHMQDLGYAKLAHLPVVNGLCKP
jgi:hypothetical protein